MNAGAIGLQLILHPLFNGGIVLTLVHIDKVDDDQPSKVTQTQLTRNFFSSFKVGLGRCVLDRTLFGRTTRVHVNRYKRFGDTDHDIATRLQLDRRVEHASQIGFDLETGKQWQAVFIAFHVFSV